jgi:hypothetical protein
MDSTAYCLLTAVLPCFLKLWIGRYARAFGSLIPRQKITRPEGRQNRSPVSILPTATDFLEQLLTIFSHALGYRTRKSRFLEPGSPYEQFQHDGSKINTFFCKTVIYPPAVADFRFRGDNAPLLQSPQSIGKNVGSNAFAGFLELLKSVVTAHHEIPNNEQ